MVNSKMINCIRMVMNEYMVKGQGVVDCSERKKGAV